MSNQIRLTKKKKPNRGKKNSGKKGNVQAVDVVVVVIVVEYIHWCCLLPASICFMMSIADLSVI